MQPRWWKAEVPDYMPQVPGMFAAETATLDSLSVLLLVVRLDRFEDRIRNKVTVVLMFILCSE